MNEYVLRPDNRLTPRKVNDLRLKLWSWLLNGGTTPNPKRLALASNTGFMTRQVLRYANTRTKPWLYDGELELFLDFNAYAKAATR